MTKPIKQQDRPLTTIERVDLAVARAVELDDKRQPGRSVKAFAGLGDQPPMQLLSAGIVVGALVTHNPRLRQAGLRMLCAHGLSTVAKGLVKNVVDRTRPNATLEGRGYALEPGQSKEKDLRSMPSGHSAGTIAAAGAAMLDYPGAAPVIAAGALSICAAQLPSKNHFLSDVVAGAAIGAASAALACSLIPAAPDGTGVPGS
ncbi:phosphatase PAP2 family protein [Sphingomonas ginkgonis]|uniref:Phosphatase PAP2 family protein n=1 Tax=Sphingomonas ginkgonis TaxID=2315330 RepID=A0A3R9WTU7_9SPHN|nr:phosphatase PAP2 family protein [Sphingomonas ginkgonis]RST31703.1 phosphatase PAP2 family protein [Sphingomonas ginkgonis]